MGKGDYLKYTKDEIQEKLIEKNIEIIEGEYKNRDSELTIKDKNGYKAIIKIGALMKGTNPSYFRKINPYTIDNIKLWCKLNNYPHEYISGEYESRTSKLIFNCEQHGKFEIDWEHLQRLRGCPKCAGNIKYTLDDIKLKTKEINPFIEILSTEYKGAFGELKCKCLKDGYEWNTNWHRISQGKGCPECKRQKFIGENNPRWNPNLTEEERQANESERHTLEYKQWVKTVLKKDGYTCKCCGSSKSGTLRTHHLNGFDNFIEQRLDVDNGVVLCENCHIDFHNKYGYGNNTKEQYLEWINSQHNILNT